MDREREPVVPALPSPVDIQPVPIMHVPAPITLTGARVQLVPFTDHAFPAVVDALQYRDVWAYSVAPMATPSDAARYVAEALADQAAGRALPFCVMAREGSGGAGEPIFAGSTRFGNISLENARVEIGWTWLLPQFQRSGVNRAAKLLLLTHAFEDLGVRRVEFKGDARNLKSHHALLGIGATYEGTLRRHMALPDGTSRDSFFFSVIAEEWPQVKTHLLDKLARDSASQRA